MKRLLIILFAINSSLAIAQNSCEEAMAVTAGLHVVGSIDGIEPSPVCSNGNGADFGEWFVYTAAEDIAITVSSDLEINLEVGAGFSTDTRLQMYTGDCDALLCLAGDDDSGDLGPNGYYSIATVSVLAGTVVYIAWDDQWSDNGFSFEITESDYVAPPDNTCDYAIEIAPGMHNVDIVDGQFGGVYSCFGGITPDAVEWFKYTLDGDYLVTISSSFVQNDGVDTRLNVYSGNCNNLVCIGNDDEGGAIGNTSELSVYVTSGTTIYIAWDDKFDDSGFDFELSLEESDGPAFTFTPVSFENGGSNLAILDMNGDFLDDLVQVSNNTGLHISYQNEDGTLNPVFIGNEPANFYPSWSMAGGDFDNNGFNDLIYGAGQGVSFMFANDDGTAYTETFSTEYVFSQRSNCVDINNDGILDGFMCHDVAPNVYYISDGEGGMTFNQGGIGDYPSGGHYGSIWVDYDNDNDVDMFMAKCGGSLPRHINQMHQNDGEGNFTEVGESIGMDNPVQTWSSAWGDFDNDGDLDAMVGASSFADGSHTLMMNDGEGNFTDVTAGSGIDNVSSTSLENITHDFDNDGYLDIVGMGIWMRNNGDMTFTEQYNVTAPNQGPVGDMNNDGFLDISGGNQLYLNNGNDNNYIKLNMLGTTSNINGIGAMVRIYTSEGIQTRQVRSGDGFKYMSTLNVHFGLGELTEIDSLTIHWPSGISEIYENIEINTVTTVTEGDGPNSVTENELQEFMVYPNPATDVVNFDIPVQVNTMKYQVFDTNGKLVMQGNTVTKSLDISTLETGSYIIQVEVNGLKGEQTIVKL